MKTPAPSPVEQHDADLVTSRRLAAGCGVAALLFGLLGLASWLTGAWTITSFNSQYIPMSPSTAFVFLCLGVILWLQARGRLIPRRRGAAIAVAGLVALWVLLGPVKYVAQTKIDLNLEDLLTALGHKFGLAWPTSISPVSGVLFFLAVIGLLLLLKPVIGRGAGQLAVTLGCLVAFSGFTGSLGYLFGTPLLYGGDIIPMAAATSLAFLFLGTGVAAAAGPDFFPLNLFLGRSTRTRLTRIFLPLVLFLILTQAIVHEFFTTVLSLPSPLVAAFNVLIFIVITIVAVERASTSVGEVLNQVMDNLEEEVTKRTLDLLIATDKLQTLIQASPVAIIALDLEGRIKSWNHAAERLFGWSEAEVLGNFLPTVPQEEQAQLQTLLQQIGRGEDVSRTETRRCKKDGTVMEISLSAAPVRDAVGGITGVIEIIEDITALKQAQEALRESEKFSRTTLDSITGHLTVLDSRGVILRTNKPWEDFAAANGLSHSLIGENYLTLCDGAEGPGSEEARSAAQGIREAMHGNQNIFSLEYPCHSPDTQRWFQMRVRHVQHGGENRVVITHVDITRLKETENEQKRLLEQLEAGRNLLRTVLEQMPAGVIIAEPPPGRIILSNRRAEELWRQPPGFLTDMEKFWQIPRYHADGRVHRHDEIPLMRALIRGETVVDEEMLLETDTGDLSHSIHLNINAAPVLDSQGAILAGVVTFLDITKSRQAEEALRHSQEQMHLLLESTDQGIYGIDPQGLCTFINRAAAEILQYSSEEVIGRHMHALIHHMHPDGTPYPETECLANQVLTTGIGGQIDDEALWRRDGTMFPAHYSCNALTVAGRIIGAVVTFSDISARKEAEEALRESEERFRTLVEMAPDIIYRLDEEGRLLFISPAVAQLGYQPEDLIGKTFEEIVFPEDRTKVPDDFVERRIGDRAMKNLEVRLVTKAGQLRDYSFKVVAYSCCSRGVWDVPDDQIQSPDKKFLCTQGIARDISDLKRVQEELIKAKEEWERTFDAVPDLIAIMNKNFCITKLNKSMAARLDATPEEITGSPCYRFMHSREHPPEVCPYTQLIADGQEHSAEVYEEKLGGYFNVTVSPLQDSAGQMVGLVHVARDITERKRAEEVMRESEEKFPLLVTQMPAVLFRGYADWTIDFFDQKIETLTGYAKADFDSHRLKWRDLILPEDLPRVTEMVSSLTGSSSFEREYRIRKKSGEIAWIHTREQAYYNDSKRLDHISGVLFDVTDRKQPEELLAWHARVDAATVDLFLKILPQTSLQEISNLILEKALELTDSPCGFIGLLDPQNGYLVCPDLSPDMETDYHIRYGGAVFRDFRGLWGWVLNQRRPLLTNTPDRDARATKGPLKHSPIFRFLSVPAFLGDDLLGQVALANASRDYNDQDLSLLQRLSNLYALVIQRHRMETDLEKTRDAAEAASRAKSEFLSSMSHELRTPMNAIIGFSEILQDQHFGPLNQKQARQINHILTSGRHLLSLINDILDLSKVESGKMTLELTSVRLADLIQNGVVMIKEKALKHQLHLETDLPPDLADLSIVADERKLKQVMFNLLSNAAKYTPDGGEIKVSVRLEGENLVVSVADTGIGIVPEDQERIFGTFERVDSSYARQQEGTGLGLALANRMVKLHGGWLWVESSGKDQGSTFSFLLPLRSAAEIEIVPKNNV